MAAFSTDPTDQHRIPINTETIETLVHGARNQLRNMQRYVTVDAVLLLDIIALLDGSSIPHPEPTILPGQESLL